MKKVLLFGSGGIIGRYLAEKLSTDFLVTKISRKYRRNKVDYSIDLLNIDQINKFVKQCGEFDCIIYLVGLAHKSERKNTFSDYNKINFLTLKNLLSSLERYNKVPPQIIFASTISVYGDNMKKTHYVEESSTLPKTFYASTKLQAEDYLKKNYLKQSWILRFAPVYSKHISFNIDRRIKIFNLPFKVGSGFAKLSLCHINNIETAVESIIKGITPYGIYNISDPIDYNYKLLHNNNKTKFLITFPVFIINILYVIAKYFNSYRIQELSIKLITDNIYSSEKIRKFVRLSYYLSL